MPKRRPRRPPPVHPDGAQDLANLMEWLDPADLQSFASTLPPDDLALLEGVLAERSASGWRATPATLGHHLDPSYQQWPYIDLLARAFVDAAEGRDPNQLWNMPSQYGKTTLLAQWVPIWLLDRDPTLRIMYVTYDAGKANEEGGKTRDLVDRHRHDLRFQLATDRRARGRWTTAAGGGLYCTSIGGASTGYPADVLLADDLLKGWQAAHSEAVRDLVWSVWRSQLRLRGQGDRGVRIVAGTRWHEDDHFARLRAAQENDEAADQWRHIRLAARAEPADPTSPDPLLRDPDPLGRVPGQVLGRFSPREVAARAAVLGPYLTVAMEQQRPTPEEGGELQRAWWRWSSAPVAADAGDDWLTSWDTKLKQTDSGDYVVGQVWCRVGGTYWLRDQLRGQWPQAITKVAVALMQVRWPHVHRHLIEHAGYGPELMGELRQPNPTFTLNEGLADDLGMTAIERLQVEALLRRGLSGLQGVVPRGDKRVRLRAISGLISSGDVVLPEGQPWAHALVDEAAAFPNGSHDDQLDAMSQALSALSRGGPATLERPTRIVQGAPPTTPGAPLQRRRFRA